MNLIIVESPTKAKTIAKFLGPDYSVKSSYGHIRDLPKGELGVDLENDFQPKYVIPVKVRSRVKEIKEAAKKATLIILATDQDREGEAIAWHIGQILKNDKLPRIVFHEITKKAILKALDQPRQINLDLVEAQQARRILDRLVGYQLSPFLWKKVAKGLSAGRVQSVTVRLIVDREKEIADFKPEEYWTIQADFEKDNLQFTAQLITDKLGLKNKEEADQVLKDLKKATYQVADISRRQVKRQPQAPFTTSTLQQEAAKRLHFSAKQTMMFAQRLYEGGLITYHRTDSLNINQGALKSAQEFIKKEFGQQYAAGPRIYKTKAKGAQEAHEAIRPTKINYQSDDKLYQLIWQRFIASQMQPAQLEASTIKIKADRYLFRATGSVIKFDGFLRVSPMKLKENVLPSLTVGEILKIIKLFSEKHFTQPPARYNEASLIKTLEAYGIGRPSTYAPIIITIQGRGYVEKNEQKRFAPTEIGSLVNGLLVEHFPKIVDLKFTAQLEDSLDKIAAGQAKWLEVIKDFYQPFQKNLKEKYEQVEKKKIEETTDKKCPKCGRPLVIKLGRFGKFYACSGFPECKYTEAIVNSTGVKCPKCGQGEIVERKTKKGKTFYSCSRYPKCDFALWNKPTGHKCPKCGSLLVETRNKQIKCSNPECDYQQK